MSKLRESIVWAILYNHSWDPGGYAFLGFYFALIFIGLLTSSIISGSYLGIFISVAFLATEIYVAKFIWSVIKHGS